MVPLFEELFVCESKSQIHGYLTDFIASTGVDIEKIAYDDGNDTL